MHKGDGTCKISISNAKGQYLIYKKGAKVPKECKQEGMLFLQYACELDTFKNERQVYGLYIACTAVFIYFWATVFIDYIKSIESTNQLDFDVKTLTAGDYSIEFAIDHIQYDNWKSKYYQVDNPMSEMA